MWGEGIAGIRFHFRWLVLFGALALCLWLPGLSQARKNASAPKLTCTKARGTNRHLTVNCELQHAGAVKSLHVKARLTRRGRTYTSASSTIHTTRFTVTLHLPDSLPPGAYTLTVTTTNPSTSSRQTIVLPHVKSGRHRR